MNTDWHDLIQRHMAGITTKEDAAHLQDSLKHDDALSRLYLRYMNLDVALDAQAASTEATRTLLTAPAKRSVGFPWLKWPSLTAAAAGVVFGMLCTSVVYGFVRPRAVAAMKMISLPVADAGFESGLTPKIGGVPNTPGVWAGDPCMVVGALGKVTPHGGAGMLRFLASAVEERERPKFMAADLWQVIALPGTGPRTVTVRGWFNAETPQQTRFHLMAVAGDGDATSAKTLWDQRMNESAAVLAACRTVVFVDRDPATWELGEMVLKVPANARVLVIGIASYRVPNAAIENWFPGQFVDDVTVTFQEEAVSE